MNNQNIYSVTQLNQQVRLQLEQHLGLIWLTGEISNFTQPVSGHWYLTLKDENAQVRCAMFRMKNARVSFRPQNGMQVLVRANVSLYEPRGDYQLIIESMHPAGDGLLQQQFEALKMKLAAEGLFAQHFKKPLPHFPRKVGIITSKTGAALQDILNILARRDPNLSIIIYPTAVQGEGANHEIVAMIELANRRQEVDVLIVGRGGGSLEDLSCFNQENVARAIFHSQIPIISAVGHETDITIADFVADLRAPTPSAAAELVSRDQQELYQQWQYKQQRLDMAIDRILQQKHQGLQQLKLRLQAQHPLMQLELQVKQMQQLQYRLQLAIKRIYEKKQQKLTALVNRYKQTALPVKLNKELQYIQQLQVRLNFAIKKQQQQQQYQLIQLANKLDNLSPLKVLVRGYSITQNNVGMPITTTTQITLGEQVKTQVSDGYFISEIKSIYKD